MNAVAPAATSQRDKPGGHGAPHDGNDDSKNHPEPSFPSSHLDPGNVSVEKEPLNSLASDFRFRRHLDERKKLLRALPMLDLTEQQRQRFIACGSEAWIHFSQTTGRYRVVATSCKLKWCPYCARARSKKVAESIRRLLRTAPRNDWRFLTLTARHTIEPLADQVAKLKSAFRRMRQRKAWKTCVNYGIGVVETTWNDATKRWHPHLHLLIAGTYFPKAIIRSEWLCASRNSFIVDIRSLFDEESAAMYIAKYLGKPPSHHVLNTIELLDEWITANTASKRIIRFGTAPETEPPSPNDDGVMDWEPIHRLADILTAAQRGDPYATRVLKLLTEKDREPNPPDDHNQQPP